MRALSVTQEAPLGGGSRRFPYSTHHKDTCCEKLIIQTGRRSRKAGLVRSGPEARGLRGHAVAGMRLQRAETQ